MSRFYAFMKFFAFLLLCPISQISGHLLENNHTNCSSALSRIRQTSVTYYSKASGNFSALSNWSTTQDGTGTSPATIAASDNFVIQSSHIVTVDGAISVKSLQVTGALAFGTTSSQVTLTISGDFTVDAGASAYAAVKGVSPHLLKIYGNIINNGSITFYDAANKNIDVEFYGSSQTISGNSPILNNITLKPSASLTPSKSLNIQGNVSIENAATFNDGGLNHTVYGNWTESGTGALASTTGGTITFAGPASIISSGSSTSNIVFNNVIFTGGGTSSIFENTTINGNITIKANSSLNAGNYTATFNKDFNVESGSTFTQSTGSLIFSGTNAQNIQANGSATFNTVTYSGTQPINTAGTVTINGITTINPGAIVTGDASFTMANNLIINGTCNWSGIITLTGGTISGTTPATLGTVTLIIAGNVSIGPIALRLNNNITIQSGYLVVSTSSTLTGQPGKTLSLADNASLYIRGANNFPTGFGTYALSTNSWTRYDWYGIDQTVRGGVTYGYLYLDDNSSSANNKKIADGPISATNSLYIYGGITLDLNSKDLVLGGNIYNNVAGGTIQGGSSTITMAASNIDRVIQSGSYTFQNLNIILNGATTNHTTTISSPITLTGNFIITNPNGSASALHTVDLGANKFTGPSSSFSLADYCQLYTYHSDFGADFLNNFPSKTFGVNSTVFFALSGNQSIPAATYGNIALNPGNKTASGSLTIQGNFFVSNQTPVFFDGGNTHKIAGNWQLGSSNYTQSSATGTIEFTGINQTISTSNFNNVIINNTGVCTLAGNLNLFGGLTIKSNGKLDANVYSLNLDGDFANTGLFTQSTGTTTFDGLLTNQSISTTPVSNFYNLVINKPNAGLQKVTALTDLIISGSTILTLNAGILDISNININFGGNLTVNYNAVETGPTFIATGSNVFFNGDVIQNIYNQNTNPLTFSNINFSGAGQKIFNYVATASPLLTSSQRVDVNGDVSINGSTVNGGTLDFTVSGNWNNNGTFTHSSSRTVTFDGTDQTISSSGFGSVVFTNTGTKKINGNITLAGNLSITNNATLEPNNQTITLAGNWINNDAGGGTFNATSGTVVFNGNSSYIYSGNSATATTPGKAFYNVTVNKNVGQTISASGGIEIKNDFSLDGGIFSTQSNSIWLGGNLYNNGGIFSHTNSSSLITLNAKAGSYTFNPGSNASLFGIKVDAASSASYSIANDFTTNSVNFIINSGKFQLNGHTLKILSTSQKIQINANGELDVDAGSTLSFNSSGQTIENTGVLKIVGTSSSIATVNNTGGSLYAINQLSGGTIHANYYKFDNLGGITLASGSFLDGSNNFSNGIFAGGSGTAYLILNNNFSSSLTASNVIFNNGPTYNISRPGSATGKITFQNYSGTLSGTTHEYDAGGTVDWTANSSGLYWTGAAGTDDWHTKGNWSTNQVPTTLDIVYLDHTNVSSNYTVTIKTADASTKQIIINGANITLALTNDKSLVVDGDLTIGNTSASVTSAGSASTISVAGNWTNLGAFTPGKSTVIFNGPAGNYTIAAGGLTAGKSFNNLTINAASAGATYALSQSLDVDNNLSVINGTLNTSSGANNLTVGGNWAITTPGIFIPNTSAVTFDGTTNQTISGGPFYHFTISGGSSIKTIAQNTDINGNLTITSGTIDAQNKNLFIAGHFTNNGGTYTQSGTGTIYFDGTGTQNIDNGLSTSTFNHVTFANAGTKVFSKNNSINGDFTVTPGSGWIDFGTATIQGNGTNNFNLNASGIYLKGTNNFPANFGTYTITSGTYVDYVSDFPQTIRKTSTWSYSNLRIYTASRDNTSSTTNKSSIKTAEGDLTITGNLSILDNGTTLDMASQNANMILTGVLSYSSSLNDQQIKWGTGTSTLTWIGTNGWNIDKNITTFNNVIFAGAGNIFLNNNLSISGDLTAKNGINLLMYEPTVSDRIFHTIKCTGTNKTFTLENGSSLNCPVPATTSVAIPTDFTNYTLGINSTVKLNSHVKQTLYSKIKYGNLQFVHAREGATPDDKVVISDGLSPLDVNGYFNTDSVTYKDNGQDINVAGSFAYLNYYIPSAPSVKITLDGNVNQTLSDNFTNTTDNLTLDLGTVEFSGSGTKTLGDVNDVINITGNLKNNSGITVVSSRPITFTGNAWDNNGLFTHSGTITFGGTGNMTINPGPAAPANYFTNLIFSNSATSTFSNNGADINGTLTLNSGTVDFGSSLTHNIYGSIYQYGGTLSAASTNFNLDGGNQDVNTLSASCFTINNITLSNSGTKRMFSDWTINGDLTINAGCTLNTYNNNAASSRYSNIIIKGNWNNQGTFTGNTSLVTFNGSAPSINIANNTSNFYDVIFSPVSNVTYNLNSPSTRFSRSMNLGSFATLNLNSQSLILGSNLSSGKVFTVAGILTVNENSFLRFNNQGSQSIMNVSGALKILGTNTSNIATLTREVAGTSLETTLNILSGATISAQYYLIEYLDNAGVNIQLGATIDPVNNFSNGRFANIRNANGSIYYLTINNSYTGTINNINFDIAGTAGSSGPYNIYHKTGNPITLSSFSGNLSGYNYEVDDQAKSATLGKLIWSYPSLATWTGAVNTNWHEAGNWSPTKVPDGNTDANIPKTNNLPHIMDNDAVCKTLSITSGYLYLDNGNNLETTGDVIIGTNSSTAILAVTSASSTITVGGSWNNDVNGIFLHGNGTVKFITPTGTSSIIPRASYFYNLVFDNAQTSFYLTGTPVNIKGSLTIKNGILIPNTSGYIYNIEKDFIIESGSFNYSGNGAAPGTVVFSGNGTQNISNANFYNLTVAGSGTKITQGNVSIANNSTILSNLKAEQSSVIDFNGDVIINAGASFDDGGQTHTFTGTNWTGTGTYKGTGTIIFDRGGTQYIYPSKFNNLDFNPPVIGVNLILMGNVSVTGNVWVRPNLTYFYLNNYLLDNPTKTGTLTVVGASNLYITGANNFPSNFGIYSLAATSTVRYQGTDLQNIAGGLSYGNLYLLGANNKVMQGDITILGSLTFNNSSLYANGHNINIQGQWYNNSNGTFVAGSGEVKFTGTLSAQYIYSTLAGANDFYNLTVDKPAGSVILGNNIPYRINNDFIINNGTFNPNGQTLSIRNNLMINAGSSYVANGTVILDKATGGATIQTSGAALNNLTINGNATFTALDNLRVNGNFTLQKGIFDGNSKRIALGNYCNTTNISGTYKTGAGGSIEIGAGCSLVVNPSGTIEIIGTAANNALVTRNINGGAGSYSFSVAGTIKAKYALFEWMYGQGSGIQVTGTVDPDNNFSYCTFTNCPNGGAMLSIENTQTNLSGANRIVNASFPSNPGGSASNVRKINQTTGAIEFYNASGVFSGETYDDDPSNLINWTYPQTLIWNGSQSSDWFTPENWTPNVVPLQNDNAIIAQATNQPVITTIGAVAGNLTINQFASVSINTPVKKGLAVFGDITINGTLNLSSTSQLNVDGSWMRGSSGTTTLNGEVIFDGTSAGTINNGISPFYNLTIAGTGRYKLTNNPVIRNDFTINTGSLADLDASLLLTVGGNWNNQGTCNAQTSTIIFNANSGAFTINPSNSSFYNVSVNASGATYNIANNTNINGNLSIMAGTINLNGMILNAGDGVGTDNVLVAGSLNINENSRLQMGTNSLLQVNNGGTLTMSGNSETQRATISNQGGVGTYTFDINKGGTLSANFYTIEYTNGNGTYFHSGAKTMDISNGIFSYGTGSYLKFENDFTSPATFNNVAFNKGPQYNAIRTSGDGIITFQDPTGILGFYLYENDDQPINANDGLLQWKYLNTYFWTGAIDNDWHKSGNWGTAIVPTIDNAVVIPNGVPHYPIIDNGAASAKSINLFAGDSLWIKKDLTIAGELINQGKITAFATTHIGIGGNWTGTSGRFSPDQSKVIFIGTNSNRIDFGTGAFFDVEIAGNYMLSTSDTILNNITLTKGTFDCTNANLTIGGNWSGTGLFVPGTNTVTFNASSGAPTIDAGTNKFYDLIINSGTGSASYTLGSPLNIDDNFTLQKGTLTLSNDLTVNKRLTVKGGNLNGASAQINVGENWTIIAPGTFTCGTSTVTLTAIPSSPSGSQDIIPGSSAFNNLSIATGASYRLANHITINGDLTLNGKLDVSASPSYNIFVAGNWDTGSTATFIPQTGVVAFNGISQSITGTTTFYELTNQNSNLKLIDNILVSDILDLISGIITTGNNRVILGSNLTSGKLNYTSGHIFGNFERFINKTDDYLFPIGSSSVRQLATIKINSYSAGSIVALFSPTDPTVTPSGLPITDGGFDITSPFTDGYWLFSANNGFTSSNYDITLTPTDFVSNPMDKNIRIIERLNSPGSIWKADGTHSDGVGVTYYRNGLGSTSNSAIPTGGIIFALANTDCSGGIIGSNQFICQGNDVNAFTSTVDANGGTNFTYTWQYSTDTAPEGGSGNWISISSSNTNALDYGSLSESRSFVRKVSGTGCKSSRYSNVIKVTVYPIPTTNSINHLKNI